ncbi:MAG: ABC transporter substrate-binding protein [Chloroflexi bacterium]|nr:ABC transporter substrate-binding protein [Chloroflexota bacterium]
MRPRQLFSVTSLIIVLGLVLASCAPAAAPTPPAPPKAPTAPVAQPTPAQKAPAPTPSGAGPTPSPKPVTEQPRQGGVLIQSVHADPPTLDPQQETSYQVFNIVAPSYSGLLQYDPLSPEKVIGDLAERWEASTDGLTHTFYLNKGVKWHDGSTLTAEDIRWSLDRHYNAPRGVLMPRAEIFQDVSKIEAPDDNTVRITMKSPKFSIIPNLARGELPMYSKKFVEARGDMKKDVMGTGPFKFKSYDVGSRFEVVKFPDYFVKGRPYLNGITFYIIKDASTRFGAFRTGRIQLTATGDSSLNPSEADLVDAEMKGKAAALKHPWLRHGQLLFNHVKGPTKDLRVRRAVSMAVDRQLAVKVLAQGRGSVGASMMPGSEWAIPEDELLKMPGYRQPKDADIAEAKKLLAEAGYPDGFETTLPVRQGRSYENDAVFMKDQLARISIKANLLVQDYAVWSKTRTSTDSFDMLPIGSALRYPDPDDFTRYYHSKGSFNFGKLNSPEVDELFSKQARTMDRAERKKVALELQRKLLDLAAAVTLCWPDAYMGVWLEVKSFKPGIGLSNNGKFQDVWLAK